MNRGFAKIGIVYVLLCALAFTVLGLRDERTVYRSFDFVDVYTGARCLVQGCDPYDTPKLAGVFAAAGGVDNFSSSPFRPNNANYPPTAFFLCLPIALLPWKIAHLLWLLLIAGTYSAAALCMAELCLYFGEDEKPAWIFFWMGAFIASSTLLIMSAQPASIAIALAILGVWCLLREKHSGIAVLLFAVSLLIKPQVAAPLWLYFVLTAKYRKRALQVLGLTILLGLPAVVWISAMPASHHWLAELRANLAGIAAHGMASDPGPANPESYNFINLQPFFAVFRDVPAFYNAAALLVAVALFAVWLAGVLRKQATIARDMYALVGITCISMLPIYHRAYEARMLLLFFPAVVLMMKNARWTYMMGAALAAAITLLFAQAVVQRLGALLSTLHDHTLRAALIGHALPLVIVALALFMLFALYRLPAKA